MLKQLRQQQIKSRRKVVQSSWKEFTDALLPAREATENAKRNVTSMKTMPAAGNLTFENGGSGADLLKIQQIKANTSMQLSSEADPVNVIVIAQQQNLAE